MYGYPGYDTAAYYAAYPAPSYDNSSTYYQQTYYAASPWGYRQSAGAPYDGRGSGWQNANGGPNARGNQLTRHEWNKQVTEASQQLTERQQEQMVAMQKHLAAQHERTKHILEERAAEAGAPAAAEPAVRGIARPASPLPARGVSPPPNQPVTVLTIAPRQDSMPRSSRSEVAKLACTSSCSAATRPSCSPCPWSSESVLVPICRVSSTFCRIRRSVSLTCCARCAVCCCIAATSSTSELAACAPHAPNGVASLFAVVGQL